MNNPGIHPAVMEKIREEIEDGNLHGGDCRLQKVN
jgi:hypothetical protein